MSIDLNSLNFDGKYIKPEDVLKRISEEEIYVRYIGDEFLSKRAISSPLRTDNVPSFSVYRGTRTGVIMWKDFVLKESGGVFSLIQRLHSLTDYAEAVRLVARDFGLISADDLPSSRQLRSPQDKKIGKLVRDEIKISVRYRQPKNYDREYWASYGVRPEVLRKYHVYAVSLIFYNDWVIRAPKYCYAYLEYKDGKPTYKIYQPFDKDRKFTNNNDYSVWEGWVQLPKKGEKLIITSSRKDVMSIVSTTQIPSIALQSENVNPKHHVVQQLKDRFKEIFVLYDNDVHAKENWGMAFGKELAEEFSLTHIWIPDSYNSKDYSDLVKNQGVGTAINMLKSLTS